MSEKVNTRSDVSKALSKKQLIVMPGAAELVLDSTIRSEKLVDRIATLCDDGTVTKNTVEESIQLIEDDESESDEDETQTENTDEPPKQENSRDETETVVDSPESDAKKTASSEVSSTRDSTTGGGEDPYLEVDGDGINPQGALQKLSSQTEKKKNVRQVINRKKTLPDRYPELCDTLFDRTFPKTRDRRGESKGYTITGDVTGQSRSTGDLDEFQGLFSDRYERLVDILSRRVRAQEIKDIHETRHAGKEMVVAGLVWDKFSNDNDNYFIELEGVGEKQTFRAIFTDPSIQSVFDEVVTDEVIAVRGTITDDGDAIFGDEIVFPDVPRRRRRKRPDDPIHAAFVSDIHVGSEDFYPEKWNRFVDYIRETPEIQYIFVAGDMVEGIGVYPDQDEELSIVDIHDQYAIAGRMFDQLPDDVSIITSVGNHDRVRLAEPQPTLPDEFGQYFGENVELVGNPVTTTVDGVTVTMYHGMSINALSEVVPGVSIDPPTDAMELMLKKRHLAPVYGKNVRFAPEVKDYLVIDEVPDILHCGHVHKYGAEDYQGTKLLNTATWQGQTSFQKSKGIQPDAGYFSVVNLSSMEVTTKNV